MRLILVRGLPGSGKSTYARTWCYRAAATGLIKKPVHLEADQYFEASGQYFFDSSYLAQAHQRCFRLTKMALTKGLDVIVANTFTQVREMEGYINLAKRDILVDLEVIKCTGDYGSVHDVPEAAMERMRRRWEDYPGEQQK